MKKEVAKAVAKKAPKKEKFNPMEHWKGMPEFNQGNAGAVKSIKINFSSMEDVLKFSKLIGKEINSKTRFLWYPEVPNELYNDKRYSDKKK